MGKDLGPLYDIAILGAGPAGSACAICLSDHNLKVALIDKATFPRDKVCGDALTQDVYNQLGIISPSLQQAFVGFSEKTTVRAIDVFAPSGRKLRVPFPQKNERGYIYTCTRENFDNLMFGAATSLRDLAIYQGQRVRSIKQCPDWLMINTDNEVIRSRLVIGADGVNSIVGRQLGSYHPRQHTAAGLRQYMENVMPLDSTNPLELYFLKGVIPAYIYIFPLPGGHANVGTGMLIDELRSKTKNLRNLFSDLLTLEPLASRLHGASAIDMPLGAKLPFAVSRRPISGNRFMLIGDAAGLVNALTGEGIGHAIRSARISADHAIRVLRSNNLSGPNLKAYDREIYSRMWNELKWSARLRQVCKFPAVLDWFIGSRMGQGLAQTMVQRIF